MQIQDGTASITNGSNRVIANSDVDTWIDAQTSFNAGAPVLFSPLGQTEVPYQVTSVTDPSTSASGFWELTLATNYAGATNSAASYAIHIDFTPTAHLPLFSAGDSQTAQLLSRAFTILDGLGGALLTNRQAVANDITLTTTLTEIPDLTTPLTVAQDFRMIYGFVLTSTGTTTGVKFQQYVTDMPSGGTLNTYGANLWVPTGSSSYLYFTSLASIGPLSSNIVTYSAIAQAYPAMMFVQIVGALNIIGEGSNLRMYIAATDNTNTITLKQGSYIELQETAF